MPTAISTITEPTPIISPRIVSPDRSLFAARPASATRIGLDHDPLRGVRSVTSSDRIVPSLIRITRRA